VNAAADAVDPAEAVADAVAACPGVVRMATGSPVEIATYLPGRRVHGVRMGDGVVEVHVVARPGVVLPDLAESVRRAVATVVPALAIDVFVDDLDLEPEQSAEDAPAAQAVSG
jgi:hypothetical protein